MDKKRRMLWLIVAVGAGLWGFLSLIGLVATLVLPLWVEEIDSASTSIFAAGSLLNLSFAIVLGAAGVNGWQAKPAKLFFPQRAWRILALVWVLFIIGAVLLPASLEGTFISAPIHVALIILPALLFFSLTALVAGRALALTWRQVLVGMAAGFHATLLALPLELIGLFMSAALVSTLAMAFPDGEAELTRMMELIEKWGSTPAAAASSEELLGLLASPVVITTLMIVLAVITPVVEELGKTLIVPFVTAWKRPGPVRAFLWGAACGVGFAMIEGVYNGAMGMGEMDGWLTGVAVRVPATAMHALVSGITGLGWGFFWDSPRKRWWVPLLCYGLAIGFHGLWNFNAVMLTFAGAVTTAGASIQLPPAMATLLLVLSGAILGILALAAPIGLLGIPLWLRRRVPQEAIAAMPE